jgi:hypothetical protein
MPDADSDVSEQQVWPATLHLRPDDQQEWAAIPKMHKILSQVSIDGFISTVAKVLKVPGATVDAAAAAFAVGVRLRFVGLSLALAIPVAPLPQDGLPHVRGEGELIRRRPAPLQKVGNGLLAQSTEDIGGRKASRLAGNSLRPSRQQ